MVDIVLLIITLLSVVLIFKDFGQDAFTIGVNLLIAVKWHSSSVNSIKLSFSTSWWSLASWCVTLCHRWSLQINFICCRTWNNILSLVATWLNNKSLIFGICINRLPRRFSLIWILTRLNSLIHAIHHISLVSSFTSWWCFDRLIN